MFIVSFMVNGEWQDQFTTKHPAKTLYDAVKKAKTIEGCTYEDILDPTTREMMCYAMA